MDIALVFAVPVLLVAVAAAIRWGRATPSSAKQREVARRNYLRDIENDR